MGRRLGIFVLRAIAVIGTTALFITHFGIVAGCAFFIILTLCTHSE